MEFRCTILHWIVATIPTPFIVVWSCWGLLDISLLFSFPTLRKSTAFPISPKKIRFVVRKVPSLFTSGWTAARQPENIYDAIKYKEILASTVNETPSVSINQGFGAEFLAAAVILRFTEGTSVLEATSTGAWWGYVKLGQRDRFPRWNESIVPAVTEECLLSAMALNLKRMVQAILFLLYTLKVRNKIARWGSDFLFC